MQFISSLKYKPLYILWAVLFAVTAVLGLFFPDVENAAGKAALRLVSVAFFIPPWLILAKARETDDRHHVRIVRYLSVASLTATLILFCAAVLSLPYSNALGDAVHILMTILCAPLVCSNLYVLPMFCWATLLIGSFGRKK